MLDIIFYIYGGWLLVYGIFALIYGCVYVPDFKKMGWMIWFLIIIPPFKCNPVYRGQNLFGYSLFSIIYIVTGGLIIYFTIY